MKFGEFDEQRREYVITNPDTPAPWANYLGSPAYGAIVTQNAGGYSFVKSGAAGRILRYCFNQFDEPGRYVYIRDREDGDFFSATWKPVKKPLSAFATECRHGTGYTEITSAYQGIECSVLYYVPLNATHEVWRVRVKNACARERSLSVVGYCEFTCESFYTQDLVNMQYTQFITRTDFMGDHILQHINENCHVGANGENGSERFFGLAGAPVNGYTGSREDFLGRGRFDAPRAIAEGDMGDTLNYGGNPCGALETRLRLKPGETREFAFVLAQRGESGARKLLDGYQKAGPTVTAELEALKAYWHRKLDNLHIDTPDPRLNVMVNTWNAIQCFTTFVWSRAASLIYCGERNGYGYRDTVQDIQGIIHLDPAMAKDQLTFMLSAQVHHGAGLPLVKYTHNAGHEDTPEQESYVRETGHPAYRADDALWLFPTVYKYIAETGDIGYLKQIIPFADRDEGTVLEHLKRALSFSMDHMGAHGMPAGLHADWNDCLQMGAKGESTFVAFQLYYAMRLMKTFAKDEPEYVAWLDSQMTALRERINRSCWEGDRFVRGITESGMVIGSRKDAEASMWLNPQSWAVISGAATPSQCEAAMNTAHRELNTRYGLQLMMPPYRHEAFDGAKMVLFNPTMKENGGIFCQAQGWAILAEALRGCGARAFQYFAQSSPASFNDSAEIRLLEPYVHSQFIDGSQSPRHGRANVHWLTGTASTVMVGCVEGILGLRPTPDGLVISPAIPREWDGFTMRKTFRGHVLDIEVINPGHCESGVRKTTLNGAEVPDGVLREEMFADVNRVTVEMG